MEMDLHHRIKSEMALDLTSISSDTTTQGNILDTKGYESLEFIGVASAITDGEYTLKVEQSDNSNMSGAEDVLATEILGSLFQVDEYKGDMPLRTGVIGKKRYMRASLVSTNTDSGVAIIGVIAVFGHPKTMPTTEQV